MPGLRFRPQALEKLTSPEQLDQLIRVTTLRSWLSLIGLGVLLVPLLAWGVWGSLETRVAAQGLLLPVGGLCMVPSPEDGLVSEALTGLRQRIEPGQVVMRMQPYAASSPVDVFSLCGGVVVNLFVQAGDPVHRGAEMLTIEPAGRALEIVAFVPVDRAPSIQLGMPARIALAGMQTEVYGYLIGQVFSVGQYPISPQTLARKVGSESLAEDLLGSRALVEVNIRLLKEHGFYIWSLNRAENPLLISGVPASVSILVARRKPLELIFPNLGP